MSNWPDNIVSEHKKFIGMLIYLGMCRACMLQLAMVVVEANTLNVNLVIVLRFLNLNLKWMIHFNERKRPLGMLNHSRVTSAILKPYKRIGVVSHLRKNLAEGRRQHTDPVKMLQVWKIRPTNLILILVLGCPVKTIAVIELPIAQTKCMKHAISGEPVSAAGVWAFFALVRTILQEGSIDIFGYLSFSNDHDLVLRFRLIGSKITLDVEWNE